MKTQIIDIAGDWRGAKNACRTTVNKEHTKNEPSSKFKTDLLISEHSPVRLIRVHWFWKNIKSWVATHWSRHKWECFISTRRSDRTGLDRGELSQDEKVDFEGEANAQNLIDTWRKRLCFQASADTRVYAEDFKISLRDDEMELSDVLVPNCIYRGGCPEFEECGFWREFKKHIDLNDSTIRDRYYVYNDWFYSRVKKEIV